MTTRCPDCGSEIAADAPGGLCPKCLYQAGLPSQPPGRPVAATVPSPGARAFTPPSVEELAGLFPQLEILELLGQGGMGAVYKARQTGLDRFVALKVLSTEISSDPAFVERFLREARALARLNHPHIVAVHDVGQAGGLYFFVMEYVDGANLRQTLRAGPISPQQALAIVPQMCDALQFAHDKGIVHRDIKPENILLDKQGGVKIADFGLAKLLGQEAPDHARTGTWQVMGTMRYMAPEQMLGTRDVDHRADIYSLGVVFYELLTGDVPMGRFAPPSKKKIEIDIRLDEVVLRALEQEPELRFQHASEVKTEVEAISRDRLPQLRKDLAARDAAPSYAPGVTTKTSLAAQILPRNGKDLLPLLVAMPLVLVVFDILPFLAIGFTLAAIRLVDPEPGSDSRITAFASIGAGGVFFASLILLGLGSLRNLSVSDLGFTLHRYAGPSRFVDWREVTHVQEISPWDVILQVWLWPGLPPRGSILGMSAQRFFRIDCREGCYYFCPRNVGQFVDVFRQHTRVTVEAAEESPAVAAGKVLHRWTTWISLALMVGLLIILLTPFAPAWYNVQLTPPAIRYTETTGTIGTMTVGGMSFAEYAGDFRAGQFAALAAFVGACLLVAVQPARRWRAAGPTVVLGTGVLVGASLLAFLYFPPPNKHQYSLAEFQQLAHAPGGPDYYRLYLDDHESELRNALLKLRLSGDEYDRIQRDHQFVNIERHSRDGAYLPFVLAVVLILCGTWMWRTELAAADFGAVASHVSEKPPVSWEDHWRATPPIIRQAVHIALALVYAIGMLFVISLTSGREGTGEAARTWMKVGQPTPWLEVEVHQLGFAWNLHLFTWAVPIGIAGLAALVLTRRLEMAEKGRAHSMWWHYVCWSIMLAVIMGLGMMQHYAGTHPPKPRQGRDTSSWITPQVAHEPGG